MAGPAPLPRRLLGVWAHPDDESYLSAGLMARVADAGGHVTVVTATAGEAGFPDGDPRSPRERARLRRREMADAMAHAGVTDVRFLGWPDGAVGDVPHSDAVSRLVDIIVEVQPELIVTFGPDGVTGHTDHVAVSQLTTCAWRVGGIGALHYAANTIGWLEEFRDLHDRLGVWMTGEPPGTPDHELTITVRLSAREINRKRAVLAGHASQTTGIAAAMGEETYRRWYQEEAFRAPTPVDLVRAHLAGGGAIVEAIAS